MNAKNEDENLTSAINVLYYVSRFTRGSRNEETRIETNRVFNGGRTEEIQEHR